MLAFMAAATVIATSVPAVSLAASPTLPDIRLHRANQVPSCATPERLMSYLELRNRDLDPRFRDIAKWYRHYGERLQVRWDYAFFQMALETNFLSYRRPDGSRGDVDPRQNNFAGIGATGGGVPGDSFPDVGVGVLAQLQHLVAYSGQYVERPVAPRTAQKQADIISVSQRMSRRVRFSDLARRWAADPRYARSIAAIADSFGKAFCNDRAASATGTGVATATTGTASKRSVTRTIWRRGEASESAAISPPPPPRPAARNAAPEDMPPPRDAPIVSADSGSTATVAKPANDAVADAAPDATPDFSASGLMRGLAAIAARIVSVDEVVAPLPRIAYRSDEASPAR
ncbi:MAG: glucosaminidase domain-containing protein [Hyphomicrobiaceae bacterium]|nr:glucosaminidase domain-containing protein [Hyphomicrobiaceae bacterium]